MERGERKSDNIIFMTIWSSVKLRKTCIIVIKYLFLWRLHSGLVIEKVVSENGIYRGPGFLAIVWLGSSPPPPLPPTSTGDTHKDWERDYEFMTTIRSFLILGRDWNFKELLRSKLTLTWVWAEVLSMASTVHILNWWVWPEFFSLSLLRVSPLKTSEWEKAFFWPIAGMNAMCCDT